jgi:type IV secretory pathway VirB10-like protein
MDQISALLKSFTFHIIAVLILSSGFLFGKDKIIVEETPIEVSFVSESEVRDEKPTEIKKPEPKKDPPKPEDDKPQPAPKALEQPKPKPAPKAEKTEEKKVERVKPTVPEKPKDKPKPKPEPQKEKPKEVEKPAEKDTQADFTSVLKNLADTQPVDRGEDGPKLTQSPTVDRVTTGELDAFRQQLQGCWSLLPGAANADALAVNLTITVNPDRTVRDVTITDRARYQSDPFFRAAADNAMRAIRHPDCTPLDLPVNKYDQWKSITLNFDPRTMF